jgi:hypothetical protein
MKDEGGIAGDGPAMPRGPNSGSAQVSVTSGQQDQLFHRAVLTEVGTEFEPRVL